MKQTLAAIVVGGLLAAAFGVQAADATADLVVHNAFCELCPQIVKGTLAKAKGVKTVAVGRANSAGEMTAEVVFDNAVTTPATLIAATTNAGYPAAIRRPAGHPDTPQ